MTYQEAQQQIKARFGTFGAGWSDVERIISETGLTGYKTSFGSVAVCTSMNRLLKLNGDRYQVATTCPTHAAAIVLFRGSMVGA